MKKLFLASLCSVWVFASNNEALISEYKKMFSQIGQKRIGVDENLIESLQPVFIATKQEKKKEIKTIDGVIKAQEELVLQAIFNSKAKIGGIWYEVGEEIDGMKIVSIHNNAVWLKNSESKKKLTIRKKNAKISIK